MMLLPAALGGAQPPPALVATFAASCIATQPAMLAPGGGRMPHSRAMAVAVATLSPGRQESGGTRAAQE